MSITASGLAYSHADCTPLFENLNFTVPTGTKAALTGNNGTGKSTLLRIVAGLLNPTAGTVTSTAKPYYVPQQTGDEGKTVAQAMGVGEKIAALRAIEAGSTGQNHYDTLSDDWAVETTLREALDAWALPAVTSQTPMQALSGGERTRVMLAGIALHEGGVVLLDEPTNHLDTAGRRLLREMIARSRATMLIVSHDRELLDTLYPIFELTPNRLSVYGGNYTFYRQQRALTENALEEDIHAAEKSLRQARAKAREVQQRQEKREAQGRKCKFEVPRIMRKTLTDSAQGTTARVKNRHGEIIDKTTADLAEMRSRRDPHTALKIDFDDATLHTGKRLVELRNVNHTYPGQKPLWSAPIDLEIRSGDRIRIKGSNGSGKTTLIKIITGQLIPTEGCAEKADFNYVYIDQDYSQIDPTLTVLQTAEKYNDSKFSEHEVKTRLHRALFGAETWDKPCAALSGGERMRLLLCCAMLSDSAPDVMILDEPTNNLDVSSMEILSRTLSDYGGTVLAISHDAGFIAEIGIEAGIDLDKA